VELKVTSSHFCVHLQFNNNRNDHKFSRLPLYEFRRHILELFQVLGWFCEIQIRDGWLYEIQTRDGCILRSSVMSGFWPSPPALSFMNGTELSAY